MTNEIMQTESMESPPPSMPTRMQSQPPANMPMDIPREPGAIKTFGVIHLVIGGMGIIYGLFSLVMQSATKAIMGQASIGVKQMDEAIVFSQKLAAVTYTQLGCSFILGVMLIIAGIQLLKIREKGRKLSIYYALTSITMKIVFFFITLLYVMPATKEFTDQIYREMPGNTGGYMSSFMQIAQLAGLLLTFTYPVIVLIVMRGKKVKQYLALR